MKRTQKNISPFTEDPFNFMHLACWKVTLRFPTESEPKWLSSMYLITIPWEQLNVQVLFLLQVSDWSTRFLTNLHRSLVMGDFINESSFLSTALILKSVSFVFALVLWNIIGSNWFTVPEYRKFCCVAPVWIVDDDPPAANDTSINWSPSLTINLEDQNFNSSDKWSRLLDIVANVVDSEEWTDFEFWSSL